MNSYSGEARSYVRTAGQVGVTVFSADLNIFDKGSYAYGHSTQHRTHYDEDDRHASEPSFCKWFLASLSFMRFQMYCAAQNLLFACLQLYLGTELTSDSELMGATTAASQLNLLYLNASFLFITAAFHGVYAFAQLEICGKVILSPRLRHLEFFFTMPMIVCSVAALVGANKAWQLAIISVLQTITTLMSCMENRDRKLLDGKLSPMVIGGLAYGMEWCIIFYYYFYNVFAGSTVIPAYVTALLLIIFSTSLLYGLNQLYFVTFARCYQIEIDNLAQLEMDGCFHLLSLVTKSLLVWVPVIAVGIH